MGRIKESDLNSKVLELAETCSYEKEHAAQVSKLALRLFDRMRGMHGLGAEERKLLGTAAILHDIGWINGQKKHHKASQEIIINSGKLPLSRRKLLMVGLIARYHRKSLPKDSHKYFSELDNRSKLTVRKLASFLRFADGLDRTHQSSIEQIDCQVLEKQLIVKIKSGKFVSEDIRTANEKSDLLEEVFSRKVVIRQASNPAVYQRHPA
jgi:exopolyphosphatase/guanosine-5'-triphosphate,3'-diphosphate pyrophosphatase